jgi:hypothetical protein
MTPRHCLIDQSALETADASAAIIIVGNGGYLLQLRDDIPGIFYPGHWSCFGGAIHPGKAVRPHAGSTSLTPSRNTKPPPAATPCRWLRERKQPYDTRPQL